MDAHLLVSHGNHVAASGLGGFTVLGEARAERQDASLVRNEMAPLLLWPDVGNPPSGIQPPFLKWDREPEGL